MQEFETRDSIFEDMDVMNPEKDYQPESLPEREAELAALHNALQPAMQDATPINTFVYGHTGQGKSVAIELKTSQLEAAAEEHGIELSVFTVGCKGMNKSYHVMTHLIKELRGGPGAELPVGYHQKELFEMIRDELRDIGGTVIVVLDEIDSIGQDDYILYELPRLSLDNVRLSLIGVTNDYQFRDNLSADVRSSLGEDEIEFAPYDATQLTSILQRRSVKGLADTYMADTGEFHSDVFVDGALGYCAAKSAQDTGDARQALKLLFTACRMVDSRGETTVSPDDIQAAEELIDRRAVERGISSLPQHPQYALLAATKLAIDAETPAETKDIRPTYEHVCEIEDVDPLSSRRYREKLNDLSGWNILSKEVRGRGPGEGKTNRYDLAVDPETVLENIPADSQGKSTILDQLRERLADV